MDNYEEQGLELAKEGVKEVLAPVTDILRQLLGPAATEAGLELKIVTPRILFPILESGSIEDDENMRDRWAALLANTATGNYQDRVYPEILRQLSAADAQLLRMCLYVVLRAPYNRMAPPWANSVSPAINEFNEAKRRHDVWECQHVGNPVSFPTSDLSVENLTRLGLFLPPTPASSRWPAKNLPCLRQSVVRATKRDCMRLK